MWKIKWGALQLGHHNYRKHFWNKLPHIVAIEVYEVKVGMSIKVMAKITDKKMSLVFKDIDK